MALTPSAMLPLGSQAPDFTLTDVVSGAPVHLEEAASGAKALLVVFLCNHCPYVVHIRAQLVKVLHDAQAQGVVVLAISSNSLQTHPQDGPEAMKALATREQWRFPFLFDADQSVAKAYEAACTPDFFLFDGERTLRYRGQFDDARSERQTRALSAFPAGFAPASFSPSAPQSHPSPQPQRSLPRSQSCDHRRFRASDRL